jgi:hypothetical protein
MNVLYRELADTECENQRAHTADLKISDKWVDLAAATRKHKAEGSRWPTNTFHCATVPSDGRQVTAVDRG